MTEACPRSRATVSAVTSSRYGTSWAASLVRVQWWSSNPPEKQIGGCSTTNIPTSSQMSRRCGLGG